MRKISLFVVLLFLVSCSEEVYDAIPDNPELVFIIPEGFPAVNPAALRNKPTKYGVELGEKLFFDPRLSRDNSIACATCHIQTAAFADHELKAVGIEGKVGLRNVPPIQNMLFMRYYNWDGSKLQLKNQVIVPLITPEEMHSSILEVIGKIKDDPAYRTLFKRVFGDEQMTDERIYKSIAQYEYSLISANSKYDKVKRKEALFSKEEQFGYEVFQTNCISCHSGELFTDQSFRNIGFPVNPNRDEAGRARVTGDLKDYMSFRVPSLRNIEFTAPYGSFGQFQTLQEVLDYMDHGVLASANLDPIFKENENRLPLTEIEKEGLIAFMQTLSDYTFIGK